MQVSSVPSDQRLSAGSRGQGWGHGHCWEKQGRTQERQWDVQLVRHPGPQLGTKPPDSPGRVNMGGSDPQAWCWPDGASPAQPGFHGILTLDTQIPSRKGSLGKDLIKVTRDLIKYNCKIYLFIFLKEKKKQTNNTWEKAPDCQHSYPFSLLVFDFCCCE